MRDILRPALLFAFLCSLFTAPGVEPAAAQNAKVTLKRGESLLVRCSEVRNEGYQYLLGVRAGTFAAALSCPPIGNWMRSMPAPFDTEVSFQLSPHIPLTEVVVSRGNNRWLVVMLRKLPTAERIYVVYQVWVLPPGAAHRLLAN